MIEALNDSEMLNNSDCISRQEAVDSMCELMHHWFGGDPKDEIREIKRELGKLPAVEPERKKGQWLTSDDMYETGVCSVCKYDSQEPISYTITMFKYCPNCGADLRDEQDESEG